MSPIRDARAIRRCYFWQRKAIAVALVTPCIERCKLMILGTQVSLRVSVCVSMKKGGLFRPA